MTCVAVGPGRAPLGHLGHRQVPVHRTHAHGLQRRHGHRGRQRHLHRPAQPAGPRLPGPPIGITVEGANILTRSLIIFGQGVIRCHPFVLNEMRAMADPDRARGLAAFDRHLGGHLALAWPARPGPCSTGSPAAAWSAPRAGQAGAITRRSPASPPPSPSRADVALLTLGGGLKRKEKLSGRMADILSHLYLVSAALKQFEDRGRPAGDLPLLQWACEDQPAKVRKASTACSATCPAGPRRGCCARLVFPAGPGHRGPSDALGHQAAGAAAGALRRPGPADRRHLPAHGQPGARSGSWRRPCAR